MTETDDGTELEAKELSEVELALVDANKAVLDVVMQAIPNSEKYLARSFAHQRDGKIQLAQPTAAAVFEMLRLFVVDPARQANREGVRKILEEEPKGRA